MWQDSGKDPSPLCHTDGSSVIKREEEGAGGRNHNATVIQMKLNYNAPKKYMSVFISLSWVQFTRFAKYLGENTKGV